MAAITQKKRRQSRKLALKTGVLTVNRADKGLVQDEADKSGDLFTAVVCGFSILVLLMAFFGWH